MSITVQIAIMLGSLLAFVSVGLCLPLGALGLCPARVSARRGRG